MSGVSCETCNSPVAQVVGFYHDQLRIRLCSECIARWSRTWKLPKNLRPVAA